MCSTHSFLTINSRSCRDINLRYQSMDLIESGEAEVDAGATSRKPSMKLRKRFKSLKIVSNVNDGEELPSEPVGAHHGVLSNGLHFYVRQNTRPRMRAALSLAVKVGSILEEEEERGVAHIVEHLAFSATKKFSNHDIIKFFESIGVEFGACQNASTSAEETIYELLVPVDKPGLLSQALSILAEFSSEIRVSEEDLEKERGAVLEEYRSGRNAMGRMQDSNWLMMMEGSKYANRQPIGLEKVLRTVSAQTVKDFYHRWYHLEHMAVVVVGDFPDTQDVVDLIKLHFEERHSPPGLPPTIPIFPVPSHDQPRFSCFSESEMGGTSVVITCKIPFSRMKTVRHYREALAELMFHSALNQRLFKLSRLGDPPFFSCSSGGDVLVRTVKVYVITASCKEKTTVQALRSILTEVARIRVHGFSEREISIARSILMANIESAYLQREQFPSTSLRDEYVQHFLHNEPVVGIEYEAQLQKTLLPHISAEEVSYFANNYRTSCNCVIKTVEPRASVTVKELKSVVLEIEGLEASRSIPPMDEEQIPDEILTEEPVPGTITSRVDLPELGTTEFVLSNGMRICYKCTDFLDDQVIFSGFAYGGLSEVSETEYLSCAMGYTIAGEIGIFGHKPSVLMEMVAGKRVELSTNIGTYMRTFNGDCSPSDLEVAFQLVYQLFITNVIPGDEEVKLVKQFSKEAIEAEERDPLTAFSNRIKELNYGKSYFVKPIRVKDLNRLDPVKSCTYFNNCFSDPSAFTVVIVGNIDPSTAIPLILRYLGGIPKNEEPTMCFDRDYLRPLPYTFPRKTTREAVYSQMVEAQCYVQITIPIELDGKQVLEEMQFVGFINKLVETRIMQLLRFKYGEIYSVYVSVFLGGNTPSKTENIHGDISILFSCESESAWRLADSSLNEILSLQEEGPSDNDVSTILEIEQRTNENGLQENGYWLDRIVRGYQSRIYDGDLNTSMKAQDECRNKVRASFSSLTMRSALRRILPFPCKKLCTVVVLIPKSYRFPFLSALLCSVERHSSNEGKVLFGTTAILALAIICWRVARSHKISA